MEVGVPELLIILVIVILLFGVGRIGKIAGEMGNGIRAFREGLRGDEPDEKPAPVIKVEQSEAETPPVTAGEENHKTL